MKWIEKLIRMKNIKEKVKEKVKRPLTRIGFDWLGTWLTRPECATPCSLLLIPGKFELVVCSTGWNEEIVHVTSHHVVWRHTTWCDVIPRAVTSHHMRHAVTSRRANWRNFTLFNITPGFLYFIPQNHIPAN